MSNLHYNDNGFDCGIMNFWRSNGYGAILNSFSLYETIKEFGLQPCLINPSFSNWVIPNGISNDFCAKRMNSTNKITTYNELCQLNTKTNTFIVGSDQIWRYRYTRSICPFEWFLSFPTMTAKRIAYAASFGLNEFESNDYIVRELIKNLLHLFDFISVREQSGVNICRDLFDSSADVVLDPVFLKSKEFYSEIANESKFSCNEYILTYLLDPWQELDNILDWAKKEYSTSNILHLGQPVWDEIRDPHRASVQDWLKCIRDSTFIITDSFHGACFSLIFNKPFICINNYNRGIERFVQLATLFNIRDLFVDEKNITKDSVKFNTKRYVSINKILDKNRTISKTWLLNALNSPVKTRDNEVIISYLHSLVNLLYSQDKRQREQLSILREYNQLFFRKMLRKEILIEKLLSIIPFADKDKHKKSIQKLTALIENRCLG